MAQETTERATARRRAALTFGADAAVLAAAGFAALAALAGRGLAPGAAGMEALGALLPELGRQAAYPLLRALGGLCGSPWAANLLGAAVGALAPALLFLCVAHAVWRALATVSSARAALGWALAAGNASALLLLAQGSWLTVGSAFSRETWDALLLLAPLWALTRGVTSPLGRVAWGWDALFGLLFGAACGENLLFAVLLLPLLTAKAWFDWLRTEECFRPLPWTLLWFALGLGGSFLLAHGVPGGWGAAAGAVRAAGLEALAAWRPWVPRAWLLVGALHLLAPVLMGAIGALAICDHRSGKMVFIALTLGGCLLAATLWPAAGLAAQAWPGHAAPMPLMVAAAVGQGLFLCGLAAWALKPRPETLAVAWGVQPLTVAAGAVLGVALAAARLWGAGQDVLRRVRLDLGLPAEAAEAFLGAAGEARVAVAAPWLDPWLIWARLGEGRGPLPLSPLRLAGRGRDALLGELLAEPTLAGADPGRLRRMADAPWALFLEDLLAARPAFRQAAVFAGPGHLFFRARLIEAPGGLWARARAEDDPPPDLAAAEAALADFDERFGPRLRRAPDPGEPRVAQPFREALRRHLSRQHNALGAAWEDAGAPGRAFAAYRQALAWDAANTVALLNAHALALAGHAPDEAAAKAVDATFRAFAKQCLQRRGSPLSLDELIALYGPLRNYALAASLPGGFATDGLAESLYALLLRAEGSPSVRALLIRAGVHLRRGEAARAEACCREALELAPDSLPALRALARLRQAAGAPGEALALLGRAPESAAKLLLADHAACLAGLGRWEEARAAAEAALKAAPDDLSARALLALADIRLGRADRVRGETLHALRASPYHEALVRDALAEAGGDLREALLQAREARARRPGSDALLARVVGLELRLGLWADAEADALALLRRDPARREALLALGLARQRTGDFDQASDYLARLVAQDGEPHPIALVALSGNRLREGRGEEALALAERAVRADPEALPAAVALAVARARTGKGDLDGALGRVRALDAEGRVPQTFFAEGWAAAARGDAKARADALARLRRLWPSLAADPEGRADAEALAAALGAAGP